MPTEGYAGGLAAIMLGLRPKEQSMAIAWLAAAAAFVLELLGDFKQLQWLYNHNIP
jgi:putative exporter of polyketide antibiotics